MTCESGMLTGMPSRYAPIARLLADYQPNGRTETADVARIRDLLEAVDDPWSQELPLHVTASAVVVHPASRRVLLRWHQRQQAWLQVGGHGDPGETEPIEVALREGLEETGLPDLRPWPDASLVHAAVLPVPARGDDPAHEHADLRFVLATDLPDSARPEKPNAPLRWLPLEQAGKETEPNVRETLDRIAASGFAR